ncbi:hypothetical protein CMV30_09930 [Nibricoccus aquaticus]|uniref:N-acetyltransferase domain-containing protein n=1 Tax=Nibricoccus aquaticus TaxID=2576891 RepID=A0A290Q7K2_9BACT|nr:GNAT family N-acetyltransferase [Nibricoccus aquaticus]ATC64247.1 hypothetical protein CMV30_09930 [Nibricoccus aquaticus]
MTIRDALLSDAAAIARLTGELGYVANAQAISDRLSKIIGNPDHLMIVASFKEEIVGWLQAHASEVLESGFRVEIVGLIVDGNARRLGTGRSLVQRAEQWASAINASAVVVRSNTVREESHLFYPAIGFIHSKTQAVYRKQLKETDSKSA